MTTTKGLSLSRVLKLLKKHTFQRVAEILGINGPHADKSIRRFVAQNGIDPKIYAKTRKRKGQKPIDFWHGVQDPNPQPKIIRRYKWHGHTVNVFEARYARL